MAAPSTDTDRNGQVAKEIKAESGAPETTAIAAEEAKEDEAAEAPASSAAAAAAAAKEGGEIKKWPGWPGDNVFRLIVPVIKVGSLIGKKGELIKKLCEETGAKVRVLDGVVGTTDRIVRTPNT